jgi:starch phosphorylase
MQNTAGMPRIAYFCMEYGLHEELHIYAGGLGILAGDIVKAAHDIRLPLVGIGILWQEGYTAQYIGDDGKPYDTYPAFSTAGLEDTQVTVTVQVGRDEVPLRVWRTTAYNNAPLYLLDANVPGSPHNWITKRLYGGSEVDRVAQEIVLGIGGVRALHTLGIEVDLYHFNEGHAVLAGLELIREQMATGSTFEYALRSVRPRIVFTTHTPVMAGNESHSHQLLCDLGANCGLNYEQMRYIGGDPFGMTVAGLRLAQMANGVSKLHGVTAREMWADIEPRAPIISITNGVHVPTWQNASVSQAVQQGGNLWKAHCAAKEELLNYVVSSTGKTLNPDSMLIGFARRAAPYKRSDFIFRRPDVIEPLLKSGQVSMIFSGKAHPHDHIGREIVANMAAAAEKYPNSVVYLQNYDMKIGRLLVQGCDVWLNNPRRPLEASGTSGMKAALNGVLNVSILDGWWPEGCHHGVNGWQFGNGYQGPDQNEQDLIALYEVLLNEVLPTYQDRERWVEMMRSSIDMAQHRFTAERMVLEYLNLMYTPLWAAQTIESLTMAYIESKH